MEQKPGKKQERIAKFKPWKLNFLRAILNKTKKNRIRSTNIILQLGVDEIKKDIQKSRLRWFGHVMWMRKRGHQRKRNIEK